MKKKNGERTKEKQKRIACKNGIVKSKRPSPLCCSWKYFVCVSAVPLPLSLSLFLSILAKYTITFEIRWWPFKHLIGIAQTNLYTFVYKYRFLVNIMCVTPSHVCVRKMCSRSHSHSNLLLTNATPIYFDTQQCLQKKTKNWLA